VFGFRKNANVEKVLTALEGYTRSFGKAPATVFSVPEIEQFLKMTADVDTTAAMLTIGHAASFSKQFVDRTDYKATVRDLTEVALRQGTDVRVVIETEVNGHYEAAKAFANEFVRLLDEGKIVGTAQVRAFIAERATSHVASWALYRLNLRSAYEDSLTPTGATQIASNVTRPEKIERALRTLGQSLPTVSDNNSYATAVTRAMVVAVMERSSSPLRSLDADGRFVGAVFAFVASDIVTQMTGAVFEFVSSAAVITLFFDVDHAAEGGTLVHEVSTAYNKMVRESPLVLQAIGENLSAWLSAPSEAQLSKLGGPFDVCRASIRSG
jgi:NAD(P)-dependent dehydrogenase (short-subunit alcohol dehydrogenase family)